MKVLITGGTGYVGGALVGALLAAGHRCVVFARTASANAPRHELVEPVDGDVRDRDADLPRRCWRRRDLSRCGARQHLESSTPQDFDEVNVGGLQNVIDACRAHGIARIDLHVVFSGAAAGRPEHARSPRTTTNAPRSRGWHWRARPSRRACRSSRWLPESSTVRDGRAKATWSVASSATISRGRLPGIVGADRIWSFAHVEDVVRAHVAALTTGRAGAEVIVGGENAPQVRLFEYLRELRGTPLPRRIPFGAAWALASIEEARTRLTGRPPLLTRGAIEIFRHDWPLDSRASGSGPGYRPIGLREGLRRLLESEK